jgi:hypothetical protein
MAARSAGVRSTVAKASGWGAAASDQRTLPGIVEFQHRATTGHAGSRRQFVGQRPHLRPADEKAGLRVLQEVFQLVTLVGGIERQEDHPGADRRQVEHQRLGRLFHLSRDAVAGLDAQ